MLDIELQQIESSQRQHHNETLFSIQLNILETEQQYVLFRLLKPRVYRDGDKWCVAYGEMPEGVFGFGNTPQEAAMDWANSWHESLTEKS